jgi:hypothetical protein
LRVVLNWFRYLVFFRRRKRTGRHGDARTVENEPRPVMGGPQWTWARNEDGSGVGHCATRWRTCPNRAVGHGNRHGLRMRRLKRGHCDGLPGTLRFLSMLTVKGL